MKLSHFYDKTNRLCELLLSSKTGQTGDVSDSIMRLANELHREYKRLQRRRENQWKLTQTLQL